MPGTIQEPAKKENEVAIGAALSNEDRLALLRRLLEAGARLTLGESHDLSMAAARTLDVGLDPDDTQAAGESPVVPDASQEVKELVAALRSARHRPEIVTTRGEGLAKQRGASDRDYGRCPTDEEYKAAMATRRAPDGRLVW
jgi:hypothetical protein